MAEPRYKVGDEILLSVNVAVVDEYSLGRYRLTMDGGNAFWQYHSAADANSRLASEHPQCDCIRVGDWVEYHSCPAAGERFQVNKISYDGIRNSRATCVRKIPNPHLAEVERLEREWREADDAVSSTSKAAMAADRLMREASNRATSALQVLNEARRKAGL